MCGTNSKLRKTGQKIIFLGVWNGFNEAEKARPSKRHSLDPYYMYIPHLNVLSEFGGKLCEEQTQKIGKNSQKPHFWGCERCTFRQKSRNRQTAHLWPLLNVHNRFQPPSSIWWRRQGRNCLFSGENLQISPLIGLGGCFLLMLYNIELSIDCRKITFLAPHYPLF